MAITQDSVEVVVKTFGLERLDQLSKAFLSVQISAQRAARSSIQSISTELQRGLQGLDKSKGSTVNEAFAGILGEDGGSEMLTKIQTNLAGVETSLTDLGEGLKTITPKGLTNMITQIDALAMADGTLDKENKELAASFRKLNNSLVETFDILTVSGEKMRDMSTKARGLREGMDGLATSNKQSNIFMEGMGERSTQTALALNVVSGAAAGFMAATSALQGNIIGMAFGLIFLKFAMIDVAIAAIGITLAIGIMLKIITKSIAAFKSFQDTLIGLKGLLGDTAAAFGAMELAEKLTREFGFSLDESRGAVGELVKAAVPGIEEVTRATIALAAAQGGKATDAARTLTQAIGFERGNLLALRDAGIMVDERMAEWFNSQDRLTRALFASDLVLTKFSGSIDDFGNSLTASLNRLKAASTALFEALGEPLIRDIIGPLVNAMAEAAFKLKDLVEVFIKSEPFIKAWGDLIKAGNLLLEELGFKSEGVGDSIRNGLVKGMLIGIRVMTLFLIIAQKIVLIIKQIAAALKFLLPFFKLMWDVLRTVIGFMKDAFQWFANMKEGAFTLGDALRSLAIRGLAVFFNTLKAGVGSLPKISATIDDFFRVFTRGRRIEFRADDIRFDGFFKRLKVRLRAQFPRIASLMDDFFRAFSRSDSFSLKDLRKSISTAFSSLEDEIRKILGKVSGKLKSGFRHFLFGDLSVTNVEELSGIGKFRKVVVRLLTSPIRIPAGLFAGALGKGARLFGGPVGIASLVGAFVGEILAQFGIQKLPVSDKIKEILSLALNRGISGGFIGFFAGGPIGALVGTLLGVLIGALEGALGIDLEKFITEKVVGAFKGSWQDALMLVAPLLVGIVLTALASPLVGVAAAIATLFGLAMFDQQKEKLLRWKDKLIEFWKTGIVKDLRDKLAKAFAPILTFLEPFFEFLEGVVERLGPIFDPVISLLQRFGSSIGPLLKGIFTGLPDAGSALVGAFSGAVGFFSSLGQTIGGALSGAFSGISSFITGPAAEIVMRILKPWEFLNDDIKVLLLEIGETIAAVFIGIMKVVEIGVKGIVGLFRFFKFLAPFVGDAMKSVSKLFGGGFKRVLAILTPIVSLISGLIEIHMKVILAFITFYFNVITRFWKTSWDDVLALLEGVWEIIAGVVQIGVSLLVGVLRIAMAIMRGDWSAIWGIIKDTVAGVWDGIGQIVTGGIQVIQQLITIFMNVLKIVSQEGWTLLVKLIKLAWKAIVLIVKSAAKSIPVILKAAWKAVKAGAEAFTGLLDWVKGLPGKILIALAKLGILLLRKGGELIKGLWNGAVNWTRDHFLPWVKGLPRQIKGWIGDLFRWLQTDGAELVRGLWWGAVRWSDENFEPWMRSLPGLIKGWIGNLLEWLQTDGQDLIKGLWDGAVKWSDDNFEPWLRGLPGDIKKWIGALATWLVTDGKDLIKGLWNGAVKWSDDHFEPWLRSLPGLILGWIGNLLEWLKEKGKDLIRGLWNGAVQWSDDNFEPWMRSLPGKILGWIGNVLTFLMQKGRDFIGGLLRGEKAMWNDHVKPWVQGLPSKLFRFFGNVTLKLWNIGWDLIKGMLKGMKKAWETVVAWFEDLPGNIIKFFEIAFSITSPSKVFMTIGEQIMAGLRIGLEAGLDGVKDAMTDVASVIAKPIPGPSLEAASLGGIALGGIAPVASIAPVAPVDLVPLGGAGVGQGTMEVNIFVSDSVIANDAAMAELAARISSKMAEKTQRSVVMNLR